MSKKLLIFVILALLAINVYTLVRFHRLKTQIVTGTHQNISENDELNSFRVNFGTNIQNSHIKLEEIMVKDSVNTIFPLEDILKDAQKPVLVCRFSELNCESCVDFAMRYFRQWADSIGKNNIVFLGAYRNNKIFNRTKPLYDIHNLNVYNVSELNIPAEELGYPYYFVLHNDMTVSDIFVPDKAVPTITLNYLEKINKRYFKED